MIFIFDWGYSTRQVIGPLSKTDARYKLDAEFVYLIRERIWFRMFFIPTIVTQTRYYFKNSESEEYEEIQKPIFYKYKDLAELNSKMMNDQISEEEYNKRRAEL